MTVEKILKDLISFNTIDDKENKEIMKYIKDYLIGLGFTCDMIGKDKKVLVAKTEKEPNLAFFGHTDTVNYKNFSTNPFELVKKDGNYYGLGVCDMKGGIAAILKVVSMIDFNKLNKGIMLVFTYDEEKTFCGIKEFIKNKISYPKNIIVGEPTDNIPMNGSKGALEYRFDFYGKKTHSSQIVDSSNINCVKFFNEILKLNDYFKKSECDEYEFKNSTMNIGIINGGERVNVVSDHTYATCDFRITKDKKEYDYIKKYVDKISKKYNMKYEIGMDFLPFYNDSKDVNELEKITGNKRKKFSALSEASILEGNKIILGPGPVTAHQDDEHISVESINETVRIYERIINYFCK